MWISFFPFLVYKIFQKKLQMQRPNYPYYLRLFLKADKTKALVQKESLFKYKPNRYYKRSDQESITR